MRILKSSPFLASCALLAFALPAQAIEPEAAATALATALSAGSRASISFDSAAASGSDIVVTGLTATDGDGSDKVVFETVTIAAPVDGGGGIFSSPSISFSGGAMSGDVTGTVGTATLNDVIVLDPAALPESAAPTPAQALLFKTAEIADIAAKPKGEKDEVRIGRVTMEVGNVVDNVPLDSKGTVDDLTIPASAFAGRPYGPAMLGYGDLVLDFTWDGSRSSDGKSMDLRDFTISLQDAGTISINGKFANMPAPTVLNDASASTSAGDIVVDNMKIRYEEGSLAGRLMDMQANKQGVTREAYAGQVEAALPWLLASLNNPDFQAKVTEALGTFLKDPKSLTVTLSPSEPISAEEIVGLARSSPGSLTTRLNAEIDANSAE
jgi:hypothetical protein